MTEKKDNKNKEEDKSIIIDLFDLYKKMPELPDPK